MFEDSLFATNRRRTPQQRWAAVLSFLLQAAMVTVLVALPLFFTEALPLSIRVVTDMPSVPRALPPENPVQPSAPSRGPRSELVDGQVVFHPAAQGPIHIFRDARPLTPPCEGVCVPGGIDTPIGGNNPIENVLRRGPTAALPPKPEPTRPTIISHMDEGLLIRKVTPVYPQPAIMIRQQGTVLLHAIIGKDGTIQQLQVVSGPPLLIQAAMEAVKQWRYRPYVLNGQPVEVDTQITVNFKLGS